MTSCFIARQPQLRHPADLAGLDFTAFGDATTLRLTATAGKGQKAGRPVRLNIPGRVRADDFETVKALILQGNSMGWLPDFLAAPAVRQKLLAPVLPGWEVAALGEVYFVYPGQKYQPAKVREFIDVALATLPQETGD